MDINSYFDKINNSSGNMKHYFASCNTPFGFVSFFKDVFNPESFEEVYILKGGPGVGKSTLLKTVAKEAEKRKMDVEYFHCSSSPTSLDGIIINDLKIAMFDGTPPHDIEPTYPGVKEIIINMGECWSIEKLKLHGDEISRLIKKKASLYKKATNYLNAVDCIKREIADVVKTTVNSEKLSLVVNRIFKSELSKSPVCNQKNIVETRITEAFCSAGRVHFESFSKLAEKNYFVKQYRGTSFLFFEQLYNLAKNEKMKFYVSFSPENPKQIDGLYFPDKSVSFTILTQEAVSYCEKTKKPYKIINMGRFSDSMEIKKKKQSLKFGEKCIKELEKAAFLSLAQASEVHDDIEALYIPATDYRAVTKLTSSILKKIFGE